MHEHKAAILEFWLDQAGRVSARPAPAQFALCSLPALESPPLALDTSMRDGLLPDVLKGVYLLFTAIFAMFAFSPAEQAV